MTNCVLSAKCCGIRIGYAGRGEIRDMTFSNLAIHDTNRGIDFICTRFNVHAQAQQLPDDQIRNLLFSNIVISDANWGITANVDGPHPLEEIERGWPNTPRTVAVEGPALPAGLRHLRFSGMAVTSRRGNYLVGSDASPLCDIVFRDVRFSVIGELQNAVAQVPEPLEIFGAANIPYGLFVRCAERVAFHDCAVDMSAATGEWKQGFLAEKSPGLLSGCIGTESCLRTVNYAPAEG